MAIDLLSLAKVSDENFLKIVFSSGDFYPGFYRFSLGTRSNEKNQITPAQLVKSYFEQELSEKKQKRNEWLSLAKDKIESLDYRNSCRSDSEIYNLIDSSYKNWMLTGSEYDIAILDTTTKIQDIELNVTYFFMGCLVRFTETSVKLGFDFLRNTQLLEIQTDVSALINYIKMIYLDDLGILFCPADVISSLSFDETDTGKLHLTDQTIDRVFFSSETSVIIASNRDTSGQLFIRWAKDILLANPEK